MAASLTILQLDTKFARVPGDVGCIETYVEEVEILRINGATVDAIVIDRPETIDITPFENALIDAQGKMVVTSCGFLSYWQEHLQALSQKQFVSSSLIALERLSLCYTPEQLMILTFDKASLTPAHLGAYDAYWDAVVGLPQDLYLRDVISRNRTSLDVEKAGSELAEFFQKNLRKTHKHILLECTNLPPYKSRLREVCDLPITDILTEIDARAKGVVRPEFL
jgi:hypothetical protein